jgi:probable HAF family extracellular repeat protein
MRPAWKLTGVTTMNRFTSCGATLPLLLVLAAPSAQALPALYHVTDLGPDSEGRHINASGEVSGIDNRSNAMAPAVWIDGAVTDLAAPNGEGSANWVNASGEVGGAVRAADQSAHAALWSNSGALTDLGAIIGAHSSFVAAIDDGGDCAIAADGVAYLSTGCTGTNLVDIGSLGGGNTAVTGFTNNGWITGLSNTSADDQPHAFVYRHGHMRDLGFLHGYHDAGAYGVNTSGHVVGTLGAHAHVQFAGFFWNGTRMAKIGTLGGRSSQAFGINRSDVVVGSAQTVLKHWHAYVFDQRAANAPVLDLNLMLDASGHGWTLVEARDINDAGQILVLGLVKGDIHERFAVLTPVQ